MLGAESDSAHLLNYNKNFSKLESDMRNNKWDLGTLSEYKFSLEMLYKEDPKTLSNKMNEFTKNMKYATIQKFIVYTLYQMPLTFSNFDVYEPLFRPVDDNSAYDIFLSLNWLQLAMAPPQLSENDQKGEFNNWIYEGEYKAFVEKLWKSLDKLTLFDPTLVLFSNDFVISVIFIEYKANPEHVLKMSIFEGLRLIIPIVVFLHLNPTLTLDECIASPILNGLYLVEKGDDVSWSKAFLTETISKLQTQELILISPTFTDVVGKSLDDFLKRKYKQ
jgi:hypothetical protein